MFSIIHEIQTSSHHVGKIDRVDETLPEQDDLTTVPLSPVSFKIAGRYKFEAPPTLSTPNTNVACVDTMTGALLASQVYPLGRFMEVCHLLNFTLPGVHEITDVSITSDRAFVFRPLSHGDLHGYLRFHRVLTERVAAGYFRQIMVSIEGAHSNGLVLRDLKLKKFVFTDSNWYVWTPCLCIINLLTSLPFYPFSLVSI